MLFNKDSKGAEEIKDLLGYIDAKVSFDNLKTDIIAAENDFKREFGKAIYDKAKTHYDTGNIDVVLDELVRLIQLPIVQLAYLALVPNMDLSHGSNGRTIMVGDEEKPAFEWQIKKDNHAMAQRAYKGFNQLIDFLNEKKYDEWTGSNYAKTQTKLYVKSAFDFDQQYPINNSHYFYLKTLSFLKRIESTKIEPLLGEHKTKVDNDPELLELIQATSVLYTMSKAIKRLPLALFPVDTFGTDLSPEDRNIIAVNLEKDADKEISKLADYILELTALDNDEEVIFVNPADNLKPENKHVNL